ncbi:MAG: FxsA family protein [Roseinatronobacter sp.]
MRILLAFLAIPIIEIALFVQIGGHIGVIWTLTEVFATGALGLILIRTTPHRTADDMRRALALDRDPLQPVASSAIAVMGAILLVLPGFFTDALGLALLLPPVQGLIIARLNTAVAAQAQAARDQRAHPGAVIIEGEHEPAPPENGPASRPRIERPHPDRPHPDTPHPDRPHRDPAD